MSRPLLARCAESSKVLHLATGTAGHGDAGLVVAQKKSEGGKQKGGNTISLRNSTANRSAKLQRCVHRFGAAPRTSSHDAALGFPRVGAAAGRQKAETDLHFSIYR